MKEGSLPKKTTQSNARKPGATRTTSAPATSRSATAARKKTAVTKASSANRSVKKHVGDVLGISRARVSKSLPRGGGRPKGIEVSTTPRRTGLKPARVVGGVRGR
jgi:hypothetical protein